MEAKDMHRHIPGATPAPPPPAPPPSEPALAHPPEPSPPPAVWLTPPEAVTEQPEAVATPVEDSPKAQEIKAELAHLDDIEATLPAHEDAGDEPEADEAEHHEGTPHRKKRRHR